MSVPAHVSLWDDTLDPADRHDFAPLAEPLDADVAVVGGGLTGLWTAHSLARAEPSLRVVVLEREHVGFGASGRNGGWCSALLPVSLTTLATHHGREAAVRMQRAMHDTVSEVQAACELESIDADFVTGGTLDLVRNEAQHTRARDVLATAREFGFGEEHLQWIDAEQATERCGATRVAGALFTPHCAALHPGKLVHGLAGAVAARGVTIHERTAVRSISPGTVETDRGRVTAPVVVRANEGYTARLPSARRDLLPIYSMMIATEPLTPDHWGEIGLAARPTFTDGRHTVIYGQRTADGRLAFGGRGAPYHFASRVEPAFDIDARVRDELVATLLDLFPVLHDVAITHHWGGPLAVSRDLQPHVRFDRSTGLVVAGGYAGDGVAASNLAGRTIADLVTGRDSELVRLPWVDHRSRRWEPEPLRWLGVNAVRLAASAADRSDERRNGRGESRLGRAVRSVLGH
ncbi:FAD-dependent oxidoreductase [soil metagenome]